MASIVGPGFTRSKAQIYVALLFMHLGCGDGSTNSGSGGNGNMTAIRYCGDHVIRVDYMDNLPGDYYRCRISLDGTHLCAITVRAPASGFGPGVAYDSSEAFDSTTLAAIAFADDDKLLDEGRLDFAPNGSSYFLRRKRDLPQSELDRLWAEYMNHCLS